MKVIKKINNNVAICIDSGGNELVAFGKGIGFPKIPYEIENLNDIVMTFYRINKRFYDVISEISENIFEVAVLIVKKAEKELKCSLNPNLVVALADHINFAIIRLNKYKEMKIIFSYDIQQLYPKESEIGEYAIKLIQKKLHVTLPESEITNIAMKLVNAEEENEYISQELSDEIIINEIKEKIEQAFSFKIDEKSFYYNRFIMHLRYYLKRVKVNKQFIDNNFELIEFMKKNKPQIYECAKEIAKLIDEKLGKVTSEDEILYLVIHIKRIIEG